MSLRAVPRAVNATPTPAIKVQILTTHISMHLMLQGFNILLATLLKPGHRLVLELSHFNVKFMNKEPFCVSCLQGVDPKYGPARMLHCIQLHTCDFFVDMPDTNTLAEAATVPVPQFQACLCDMMVGDVSWLPMLPQQHCSIMLPKVLDPKTENKINNPNGKTKLAQMRNLNMSF